MRLCMSVTSAIIPPENCWNMTRIEDLILRVLFSMVREDGTVTSWVRVFDYITFKHRHHDTMVQLTVISLPLLHSSQYPRYSIVVCSVLHGIRCRFGVEKVIFVEHILWTLRYGMGLLPATVAEIFRTLTMVVRSTRTIAIAVYDQRIDIYEFRSHSGVEEKEGK
jgi:hypothetical protein